MVANVGTLDRVLRIVIGVLLVGVAVAGIVGPWGYIGAVPLVTGLARRCPAYSVLG
jgi:hypothetical protein